VEVDARDTLVSQALSLDLAQLVLLLKEGEDRGTGLTVSKLWRARGENKTQLCSRF